MLGPPNTPSRLPPLPLGCSFVAQITRASGAAFVVAPCAAPSAPAPDGESEAMSFYDDWSAVLIASIVGFFLVFSALIGARLLGPFARERGKGVSYECGMLPIGRNWAQVHVRYYVFAIMFLIFDVETIFIFPWAVVFLDLPAYVFWYMFIFIVVLSAGLLYAWRRGVLEWR